MKYLLLIISLIIGHISQAQQKESFDFIDYVPPSGWKKETTVNTVTYTHVNADNKSWCQLTVFRSIASKGNIIEDFTSEWEQIVVKNNEITSGPATGNMTASGNWQFLTGTGSANFNGNEMLLRLTTVRDTQVCLSILSRTNNSDYFKDIDRFLSTIEPSTLMNRGVAKSDPMMNLNTSVAPLTTTTYSFTVSNFDDGWVSSVQDDHVRVDKGDIVVLLNYTIPFNADQFSGTGITARDYYWDQFVSRKFEIQAKQYNDGSSMVMRPPYVEGYAKSKLNGKTCFIGMYLLISINAVSIVIGSAPNEASFRQQFPAANDAFNSDLAAMNRYNKFAIALKDLVGKWQNGSTETAQWYYVNPSGYEGYAGMTVASSSATFLFNGDNTYSSIHNGATGSVGAMNTFQQEYKGQYTVSNWMVAATNRYEGKTDKFDAYFVAVNGGRILKLKNGAGQEYSLVKSLR